MAEVIQDLGLRAMIDARLVPDAQEDIPPGEAVAGMILKGLGCAHRPLSLPPQFFTQQPLARLFRQGVRAERCHRLQRGRTLDEVHPSGGDRWWSDMAVAVCADAGIAWGCDHLDTTRFALTGAEVPESDAQGMTIRHGHAKDHRPDGQQAV